MVSVPVLSVQSTSMAPKFWMELRRLTMTFFRDMARAPLDRQTETIIGSISGVSPTATASEKKKASCQSCLVRPLMTKTSGTMTSMNRIISQVNFFTPRSKAVSTCWPARLRGHLAEIGLRAGGDNHRRGRAALDAGAQEAGVGALDGGDAPAQVAGIGLLDRHGFAGQRRLDDEQVLGRQEPHIAGHHVAGGELHDVAGHELLEGNLPGLAVAHDGGGDADHRLELGGGGVRAGLLHEAQRHSQHHHQQHHRAGPEVARCAKERMARTVSRITSGLRAAT